MNYNSDNNNNNNNNNSESKKSSADYPAAPRDSSSRSSSTTTPSSRLAPAAGARATSGGAGTRPQFVEKPLIRQTNNFKQVQFDCKLLADPEPHIQWLHKGAPLDHVAAPAKAELSRLAPGEFVASLTLMSVEAERTGEYKCLATNQFGSSSATINLNFVQEARKSSGADGSRKSSLAQAGGRAPKFPRKPLIKQSGSVLTIECVVEARPRPSINWYYGHESIIKEASRHSHCAWHMRGPIKEPAELRQLAVQEPAAGGEIFVVTLDIRSPKAEHAGTYRCNAVNEFGESSANIALNFQTAASSKEKQQADTSKADKQQQDDDVEMKSPAESLGVGGSSKRRPSKQQEEEEKEANKENLSSQQDDKSTIRRRSSGTTAVTPMDTDGGVAAGTNRISGRASISEREDAAAAGEQLAPAKRTSSSKRTTSVKKSKRPSLLGPESNQEAAAATEGGGNSTGEVSRSSSVKKKRVSVKRDRAEAAPDSSESSRRSSAAAAAKAPQATSGEQTSKQQAAAARIPSVAIVEPTPPTVSVTTSDEPTAARERRRGTYENLRADQQPELAAEEDESPEELEQRRRYLASRGGSQARESLSPQQRQSPASAANSRPSSPGLEARRGSILLLPDGTQATAAAAANDGRRPSIIVAADNKLRPGEIADKRRRSSIDIRRASANQLEAADRPSTPLKPCGKKPTILDFQDNISGTENHTSYLTFGLEGDPVPQLRFFKGDSEIYEGGRYSVVTDGDTNTVHFCIRKSKPMDEAKYRVVASNEHGEDSASMQLFVSDESGMDFRAMLRHRQYAKWKKDQDDPNWGNLKAVEEERLAQIKEPKRADNFLKPLQNQRVKQGRDMKVRFECVFSKSGVKAKWFRNNKEIFPTNKFHLDSRGDLHVLEIEAPTVEDAGRVTCQCLDTKCSAMLEVEEPEPVYKFTRLLSKGHGQYLNRELVLECTANSHKAQVEWTKDKRRLEPTEGKFTMEADKFGKKILRIAGCQLEDSGQYVCRIVNTPRADELTSTQVQISEKKFQIMKPLYSQRATEDDRIVLECEVDELDAPVRWFKKDRETGKWKELRPEQLKSKEIQSEGKKRRLVIKKAKCQDEGEYRCATNADETTGELFVEPSNKWLKKLQDVTIVEDEPLILDVEPMDRKPGVALVWLHNGKQVGHQGGAMQTTADERIQFKLIDDKLQLTIPAAKQSDAGDWSVLFNKMKCACKVQVLPAEKAPTMKFPMDTLTAEVGKPTQVEIPYQVQGTRQSPVGAKLLCNGQPVAMDKVEFVVTDNKVLMRLKNPQRADSSDAYEFVLENYKGKQSHKFKLDVQGTPDAPQGPLKVDKVRKDGCRLQWERPLDDGGCPIVHYVVERQEVASGRTTWTECGITSTCELDVNDLQAKKEYKFRVRAVNKKGKSEPLQGAKSVLAKDPYDPPSEPENVTVVNWDKDFVDLEWEAPLKDGGVPIERYIIESKGKFAQDWTPVKEIPAGAGCKAHITETLKEGQQLQFRVRAANKAGAGEPSKATKPVAIKARFVRPYLQGDGLKNVVVKKGRPIRYEIQFNGEPAPEVKWLANEQELRQITDKCEIESADKKTTLLVTNTTRADSGRYKLVLTNSSGQFVTEADVVVLDRPTPPEGPLVVEEIKCDQVTIKWRKPKDTGGQDIDGYVVEKMNLETGRWVPAGECGPKDESFTVTNLMKGKKYKFRVRAKNKEGESEPLETANTLNVGEEPTVQKCPQKVTVGQGETAKVKVHFQGEPSEFRVINMDTGEVIPEAGSGGADGPKYTVFDDYLTVTIPNAQKKRHAGRYKVELKNKIGSCDAQFELDVTGAPGAPQGPLEIGEVSENSVQLAWRPPADDGGNKVTHYVVERRDISQGADAWIEVTSACKDTTFNVQGLTKDQSYEFRVMAVNENGQSEPLRSDRPVQAKLPYDPPSPPGQPEATPISDDSVRLEWEKPKSDGGSRISGYLVEKREVGSDTWQKVNQAAASLTTECVVKNLIEDRKYEFRVIAQNAAGNSEPSECSAVCQVRDPNASDVPKFVRPLRKVVATEDGSFELECVVQGNPAPSVVWSKGNKDIREGGKYCMSQESGPDGTTIHRLLVSRAAADDADEYSIKATNKAGSRTSRCDVEIQTKPKIHVPPRLQQSTAPESGGGGSSSSAGATPSTPATTGAGSRSPLADGGGEGAQIGQRAAPITFDRGESIQLKIPFTGNPAPECHWFKGDEEIEAGAQFDIDTDGRHTTLTIRDATREDSGEYRLVVRNKLGEDSATFSIAVADRPEPPRFPTVAAAEEETVSLKWLAPLWDGGSQITQYIVEKRELPMSSWIRAGCSRFPSHQVVNLNDEKEYEFRVFAENIYGRSEPSELVRCSTKPSSGGAGAKKLNWPLDAQGKKIRSQLGDADAPDDYDKFVRDQPANHMAADIKTCPITDNYDILEKIGEGIFGEVYRVREKSTGDYYAAKFTPIQNQEEKSLLRKEIDTINLLHHTNTLRLHDAYEQEDEMATVHEFISGPELLERACEPGYQMTEDQVRKYMRDVCEAVRHMHDRNVIHLDLKPEVLVLQSQRPLEPGHEPKVKIVDFGLACKLDPHEICKISTSTPDYAAPEILEKDSVGFYTDMWAVGVLAYVLLCGRTPFGSQADIKAAQWSFEGEPAFAAVSGECRDFIERLLVRQKEKRMTAHEALEHPWLREQGDEATRQQRRRPLHADRDDAAAQVYRRERDAMRHRYLDWWHKSRVPIGHISNYSPLRKLYADRYKIHDALLDRRELAPRFVIKPHSTFAYETQTATFYCLISSDSPFTVSWFKDSQELKQSVKYMKRYTLDKNFQFNVNRCKMSDFGEYVIRAENHHGAREEPVFLDVRKRPVDFTPVHLEPMRRRREPEPPKFEEEPDCAPKFNFLLRPRVIQSGQSVKLLCCVKAKPVPTISWFKDGKELSKRDFTLTHSDGVCTLEIASCEPTHSGKYSCRAENSLGHDQTTSDVLIEAKRTFTPTPIVTNYQTTSTLTIEGSSHFTPQFASGRHQRSLSLSRRPSAGPMQSAGSQSRTIQAANLLTPNYFSYKIYSPNFSMNTNRYLRRSYKTTTSTTSSTTAADAMPPLASTRYSRSRIPRTISRFAPMRSLSSYGRSSSSLQ